MIFAHCDAWDDRINESEMNFKRWILGTKSEFWIFMLVYYPQFSNWNIFFPTLCQSNFDIRFLISFLLKQMAKLGPTWWISTFWQSRVNNPSYVTICCHSNIANIHQHVTIFIDQVFKDNIYNRKWFIWWKFIYLRNSTDVPVAPSFFFC